MAAVVTEQLAGEARLPLLVDARPGRLLAFGGGRRTTVADFLADVAHAARALPDAGAAQNLCEDRYRFLVAFCAAASRGQASLLPPSRAPGVVADVAAAHPDSYCLLDHGEPPTPPRAHRLVERPLDTTDPSLESAPGLPVAQRVAVGFTSGSTGRPQPNPKTWGSFSASSRRNIALLEALLDRAGAARDAVAQIVATVPPQHMYGMETTVLLPLLGRFAVHAGRPFFPAEVAEALSEAEAPRLLVTTPVHLRALVSAGIGLPPLAGILSATAPLPQALAGAAEDVFCAPVLEMFGSTETCVIAHRRTAREADWTLYDGIELHPQPDGVRVDAPWLAEPVVMQDVVELLPERRFRLSGRNSDLLEIAGKRASLGDITRRLLDLDGVVDAVALQAEDADEAGIRRVAALVVAPGRRAADLLTALREHVDPVFLPRPLRCVDALPRNETGKLPRAALLDLLRAEG